MARYRVLFWRGIPAQVKVDDDGRWRSAALSERWQQEIDRVAMAEGIVGSEEYLEAWEWSEIEDRPGKADEVIESLVAELEATWEERRRRGASLSDPHRDQRFADNADTVPNVVLVDNEGRIEED